jgi:hypothetical protein
MSGYTFVKDIRNARRSVSEVKEFSSIEEFVQLCSGTRVIKKVCFLFLFFLERIIISANPVVNMYRYDSK